MTAVTTDTTGSVHLPCPASRAVGSLPLLNEFAAPVHQAADTTAEQNVHVPVPQIQEQYVEGVKVIPHERFPERTLENIVDVWVPPTVEDTVEVAQIIPDSPVPQTVEESSEVVRLQELLLSSVAALGAECGRCQKCSLPASPPASPSAKSEKKGRHKK